jgi:hypothetical protein
VSNNVQFSVGDLVVVADDSKVHVEGGIMMPGDVCLVLTQPTDPRSAYKVQSGLKNGFLYPNELERIPGMSA